MLKITRENRSNANFGVDGTENELSKILACLPAPDPRPTGSNKPPHELPLLPDSLHADDEVTLALQLLPELLAQLPLVPENFHIPQTWRQSC